MSYQLSDIQLPATKRIVSDTQPLSVGLGGLSANDATTLCVVLVVGVADAGITALNPASVTIENTFDDGVSWTPVPALDIRDAATGLAVNGITGVGSFLVYLTGASGILSPSARITTTPPAGTSLYFSYIRRTHVGPGGIVVPRAAIVGSSVGPGPSAPATRVSAILGDPAGVDMDTVALAAAQKTQATVTHMYPMLSFMMGWDGSTHREVLVDTSGRVETKKPEFSSAYAVVTRDFSSAALVAATWSQLIASTSAKSTVFRYTNTSGETLELGFGAGGAEVSVDLLASAGSQELLIPAGTRVSIRSASAVSTGLLYFAALV
jgi:hypothetical protein